MIALTIAGQTFEYPEESDNPPWGAPATDWAEAVTAALGTVVGTGDITQTSCVIANNVTSPINVVGLSFSDTAVRAAVVIYSVYRVTTGVGAQELVEVGTMYLSYKSTANSWDLAIVGGQNAGITFTVTNPGQVQYVDTNMTGSNYSGKMVFRAQALAQ